MDLGPRASRISPSPCAWTGSSNSSRSIGSRVVASLDSRGRAMDLDGLALDLDGAAMDLDGTRG